MMVLGWHRGDSDLAIMMQFFSYSYKWTTAPFWEDPLYIIK